MDAQRSAELQVVLEGVPLPAERETLIRYAAAQDPSAAADLERLLPEGEYDRLDAVGDALLKPPRGPAAAPKAPRPESGEPPGGAAYLDPSHEAGAVRPSAPRTHPPQKVLEEQTELQQRQQRRQEG